MELNWIVYLNRTHSIQAFSLISWSGIRELGFVLLLVTVNLRHNNLFLLFLDSSPALYFSMRSIMLMLLQITTRVKRRGDQCCTKLRSSCFHEEWYQTKLGYHARKPNKSGSERVIGVALCSLETVEGTTIIFIEGNILLQTTR